MSWSVFKAKCNVLTGNPHVTIDLFADTIAGAYHDCVSLHFDTLTGGGQLTNNQPKKPILSQQIKSFCEINRNTTNSVELLQQIGPAMVSYWVGLIITGPVGFVTITSPGTWSHIPTPPNTNFQIILNNFMLCARTHIMTLTGIYTSTTVPGVTSPWSGALLQSLP